MASVTSLMNSTSSTSSLYGNRNVISGLASGMDTESMIENSISGYKSKISSLQQKMTKMQWKQDAYRNLITQMNNVLNKYTSYTSSTNLFSSSFFSQAVNTVSNGANASAVSATGKSSSNVAINSIKQLAESASYTVGTKNLVSEAAKTDAIEWNKAVETSNVEGSISIKYGGGKEGKGSTFTLRFTADEVFSDDKDADGNVTKSGAQKLADSINEKLKQKNITAGEGSKSADEYIQARVDDNGRVVLEDQKGNYFAITSVTGGMTNLFEEGEATTIDASGKRGFTSESIASGGKSGTKLVDDSKSTFDYLKDKTINVTLDGKSKSISLDFIKDLNLNDKPTKEFAEKLQEKLDDAFGKGKVSVGTERDENGKRVLKFTGPDGKDLTSGTTFSVAGSNDIVNKALGLGEGGYSNTLKTSWTLGKTLGDSVAWTEKTDKDGNKYQAAEIEVNGTKIEFKSTDTIQNLIDKVNASDAGVEIKYSSMTGNFAIASKETGAASELEIGGELGNALFGGLKVENGVAKDAKGNTVESYKGGQDAVFNVTINGEDMELTRSSNTVNLDGMNVTLKSTFEADPSNPNSKITFTTSSDSDKIVDAVKAFVEDYNKLVTDLHSAYRTETLKNSKGKDYSPLTDDDMSSMSESSIKAYEDKAKTGILFGDQDLSNLYSRLTEAVQGTGAIGSALRSIGLNVSYADGLSTLSLDEDALRSALDNDPDKVRDAFTQTTASGASANGLMASLKSTLEMYGSTSIANPGILVNKAGTTLSSYSLNHNEMQDQMDSLQEQIEKWQDKMSDRVDYYTNKFTQLEMLINQMNSQSSMLSGMMGGY